MYAAEAALLAERQNSQASTRRLEEKISHLETLMTSLLPGSNQASPKNDHGRMKEVPALPGAHHSNHPTAK